MSNIEKIRQEIDMYIKSFELNGGIYDSYEAGELNAYKNILAFIDSLPEEKQSEDLEEAVFKEWGTTKEEYLAKSMDKVHLEMEIATYLQDWDDDDEIGLHLSTDNGSIPIELEDIRDLARHFAEWQKEQMMKDAVEGEVENSCFGIVYLRKNLVNEGYSTGDKVKIIIVKEDGNSDL